MTDVNLNTFSPKLTVAGKARELPSFKIPSRVCVVGAGAFGGWTALHLHRLGFKVTLIDAWGPGNSRSSSGDETRVIRSTYGGNELYFQLNVRALELWKKEQTRFQKQVFCNAGVLWLCYQEANPIVDDSIPFSDKYNARYERLSQADLRRRYPLINVDDLSHAFLDPNGGYLKARESCQEVVATFIREGGTYIQSSVSADLRLKKSTSQLTLANGTSVAAEVFVFACGSWLPSIFPQLKNHLSCSKQEVYYFGVPREHSEQFDSMPVWIDLDGEDFYYGIPGNAHRGFKIGVDKRGTTFDPTHDERTLEPEVLAHARAFLAKRFPLLSAAPLLENRVCPYENSASGNFICDLLPDSENVFILGGGSGHGFKHGPALGELIAKALAGQTIIPDLFRLT
jgi:glycine/D-amino acid oxidase-like deaminating enzyme